MHHCLRIQEVLHIIFNCIDDYECVIMPNTVHTRTATSLNTLASLARTCKVFKEQALDVLWCDVPSMCLPMKYLLPGDVVDCTQTTLVR